MSYQIYHYTGKKVILQEVKKIGQESVSFIDYKTWQQSKHIQTMEINMI